VTVEQRNYSRYKVAWRAKVAVPGKGLVRGQIKGVSLAGGYLEFPFAMPINSVVLMEVYPFLDGQVYPVRLRAKVIYDTLLSENRGHGMGLKVLEIADADRKILTRAINALAIA
jgi:hypothetical protein